MHRIYADTWKLTPWGLYVVGSQPTVPPSIREFYYTAKSEYTRSVYNTSASKTATGYYYSDIKQVAKLLSEQGVHTAVHVDSNSIVLLVNGIPFVNPNAKVNKNQTTIWTTHANILMQCITVGRSIKNTIDSTDLFGVRSKEVEALKQTIDLKHRHSLFVVPGGYSLASAYKSIVNNQSTAFVHYGMSNYAELVL